MTYLGYANPYYGKTFFGFWGLFLQRLIQMGTGQLGLQDLAADEIQLLALVIVAVSAALVGTFLVLRRMTMLANSLSHTILLGIVIAFLVTRGTSYAGMEAQGGFDLQTMMVAALLSGFGTTFLTEILSKVLGLQEDAATGLVFTSLFAIGIVLVTVFSRNAHVGAEVVMGNADALYLEDLHLVGWILVGNVSLFTLFFKEYQLTAFDTGLAKALGVSTVFFNYLLMAQVSATAIGAFRAVGVLMVLAFITGPALTARLLTHDLKRMLFLAVAVGALAAGMGVALSRHLFSVYILALSTSGLVVCMIVLLYILAVLLAPEQGLLSQFWKRKRQREAIGSIDK